MQPVVLSRRKMRQEQEAGAEAIASHVVFEASTAAQDSLVSEAFSFCWHRALVQRHGEVV